MMPHFSKHTNLAKCVTALTTILLLSLTGCRTPTPAPKAETPLPEFDVTHNEIARLHRLLGISARTYKFTLQTNETLVIHSHAQKNKVDVKGDTFIHEIPFAVYEKFVNSYPAFEPVKGLRTVDLEILKPGNLGDPDRVKISLKMPGHARFYYLEDPSNSMTGFGPDTWIKNNKTNLLLNLRYTNPKGDTYTLKINAAIRSDKAK